MSFNISTSNSYLQHELKKKYRNSRVGSISITTSKRSRLKKLHNYRETSSRNNSPLSSPLRRRWQGGGSVHFQVSKAGQLQSCKIASLLPSSCWLRPKAVYSLNTTGGYAAASPLGVRFPEYRAWGLSHLCPMPKPSPGICSLLKGEQTETKVKLSHRCPNSGSPWAPISPSFLSSRSGIGQRITWGWSRDILWELLKQTTSRKFQKQKKARSHWDLHFFICHQFYTVQWKP